MPDGDRKKRLSDALRRNLAKRKARNQQASPLSPLPHSDEACKEGKPAAHQHNASPLPAPELSSK